MTPSWWMLLLFAFPYLALTICFVWLAVFGAKEKDYFLAAWYGGLSFILLLPVVVVGVVRWLP